MISKTYRIRDIDNDTQISLSFLETDECPICHFSLRPEVKSGYYIRNGDLGRYSAYLVCFCTKCREIFLAKYNGTRSPSGTNNPIFEKLIPITPNTDSFSAGISELSPTFVNTYNQAQFAESQGLTEICGIGYRRALEFLVKDYLIHLFPDQEEAIKSEFLGKSIQRINNDHIKVLAERSTWIGNDETHYVRKHEDFDYTDMKRFIVAMVRYVDSELTFEEALSIPPK